MHFVLGAILFLASSGTVTAPQAVPSTALLRDAVGLIHDGRFDEADEALIRLEAQRPDDPAPVFFAALVSYWRLLYDDENAALARTLEERLVRAARIADAARPPGAGGAAALWGGYSRLFLAQFQASRKKTWAAVKEGRAARRLLGQAAQADPASAEPLCGLGTYNYYADRVSAIVKGVRFLLGLPSGDRELGLDQLEAAASRSEYFALEARLVLAAIYAGRHERLYHSALQQARKALALEPQSVGVLDAAARLYVSLGMPQEAEPLMERARARAATLAGTDSSVVAALAYQRARAAFTCFRPDLALQILHPLEQSAASLPTRLRREVSSLTELSRQLVGAGTGGPPDTASRGGVVSGLRPEVWNRLQAALETERTRGPEASAAELLELDKQLAGEPAVWMQTGRALLRSGRAEQALEWLDRADDSHGLPDAWVGPCRILAGQAADLAGRRQEALERYRRAIKAPAFIERNAAYLYQQSPFHAEP